MTLSDQSEEILFRLYVATGLICLLIVIALIYFFVLGRKYYRIRGALKGMMTTAAKFEQERNEWAASSLQWRTQYDVSQIHFEEAVNLLKRVHTERFSAEIHMAVTLFLNKRNLLR